MHRLDHPYCAPGCCLCEKRCVADDHAYCMRVDGIKSEYGPHQPSLSSSQHCHDSHEVPSSRTSDSKPSRDKLLHDLADFRSAFTHLASSSPEDSTFVRCDDEETIAYSDGDDSSFQEVLTGGNDVQRFMHPVDRLGVGFDSREIDYSRIKTDIKSEPEASSSVSVNATMRPLDIEGELKEEDVVVQMLKENNYFSDITSDASKTVDDDDLSQASAADKDITPSKKGRKSKTKTNYSPDSSNISECGKDMSKVTDSPKTKQRKKATAAPAKDVYSLEDTPYICGYCAKRYTRSSTLSKHLSSLHGVEYSSPYHENSLSFGARPKQSGKQAELQDNREHERRKSEISSPPKAPIATQKESAKAIGKNTLNKQESSSSGDDPQAQQTKDSKYKLQMDISNTFSLKLDNFKPIIAKLKQSHVTKIKQPLACKSLLTIKNNSMDGTGSLASRKSLKANKDVMSKIKPCHVVLKPTNSPKSLKKSVSKRTATTTVQDESKSALVEKSQPVSAVEEQSSSDYNAIFECIKCDSSFRTSEEFFKHFNEAHQLVSKSSAKIEHEAETTIENIDKDADHINIESLKKEKDVEINEKEKVCTASPDLQDNPSKKPEDELKNNSTPAEKRKAVPEESKVSKKKAKVEQSSSYSCPICARMFQTSRAVQVHCEADHTDNDASSQSSQESKPVSNKYSCPKCSSTFATRNRLDVHYDTNHLDQNSSTSSSSDKKKSKSVLIGDVLFCKKCWKGFRNTESFDMHTLKEDEDGNAGKCKRTSKHDVTRFKIMTDRKMCLLCEKPYTNCKGLERHFQMCHKATKLPYKCGECNTGFLVKARMLSHVSRHSDSKVEPKVSETVKCQLCEKEFCNVNDLENHKQTVHMKADAQSNVTGIASTFYKHVDMETNRCLDCQKAFLHKYNLEQHFRFTHKDIKLPFKCRKCPGRFISKCRLLSHKIKAHSTSGSSSAKQKVPQSSEKSNKLKIHKTSKYLKLVNIDTKTCNICKIQMSLTVSLERHFFYKHKEVKLPFECADCGAKFFTKLKLNKHILKLHVKTSSASDDTSAIQEEKPTSPKKEDANSSSGEISKLSSYSSDMSGTNCCMLCCRQYTTMLELEQHFTYVHKDIKLPYLCEQCNHGFFTPVSLNRHTSLHIGKPAESIPKVEAEFCSLCNNDLQGMSLVEHSMRKHKQCIICKEEVKTVGRLEEHLAQKHSGKHLNHQCQKCDKRFIKSARFEAHVRNWHTSPNKRSKKTTEDNIQESSSDRSSYTSLKDDSHKKGVSAPVSKHSKQASLGDTPSSTTDKLKCPECSRQFDTGSNMEKHFRSRHRGKKMPLKCKRCNLGFFYENTLLKHQVRHPRTSKIVKNLSKKAKKHSTVKHKEGESLQNNVTVSICPICDEKFASTADASRHFMMNHEQSRRPFACEVCRKGFFSNSSLKTHYKGKHPEEFKRLSMTEEKPTRQNTPKRKRSLKTVPAIKCRKCHLKFGNMNQMKLHIQEKHRDFKCKECKRTFIRKDNLQRHVSALHKTSTEPNQKVKKVTTADSTKLPTGQIKAKKQTSDSTKMVQEGTRCATNNEKTVLCDLKTKTAALCDSKVKTATLCDSKAKTAAPCDSKAKTAALGDSKAKTAALCDSKMKSAALSDSKVKSAELSDSKAKTAAPCDSQAKTAALSNSKVKSAALSDSNVKRAALSDSKVKTAVTVTKKKPPKTAEATSNHPIMVDPKISDIKVSEPPSVNQKLKLMINSTNNATNSEILNNSTSSKDKIHTSQQIVKSRPQVFAQPFNMPNVKHCEMAKLLTRPSPKDTQMSLKARRESIFAHPQSMVKQVREPYKEESSSPTKQQVHRMAYHCRKCFKGFLTEPGLKNHMQNVHTPEKKHNASPPRNPDTVEMKVDILASSEVTRAPVVELPKPEERASNNNNNKYQCPVCGNTFLTLDGAEIHFRIAHGSTKMPFQCASCDIGFLEQTRLDRHRVRYHNL